MDAQVHAHDGDERAAAEVRELGLPREHLRRLDKLKLHGNVGQREREAGAGGVPALGDDGEETLRERVGRGRALEPRVARGTEAAPARGRRTPERAPDDAAGGQGRGRRREGFAKRRENSIRSAENPAAARDSRGGHDRLERRRLDVIERPNGFHRLAEHQVVVVPEVPGLAGERERADGDIRVVVGGIPRRGHPVDPNRRRRLRPIAAVIRDAHANRAQPLARGEHAPHLHRRRRVRAPVGVSVAGRLVERQRAASRERPDCSRAAPDRVAAGPAEA